MKKETNKIVPIFGRMALARLCAALFFVSAVLGTGSALPKKLTDILPFGQALRPLTAQAAMPDPTSGNWCFLVIGSTTAQLKDRYGSPMATYSWTTGSNAPAINLNTLEDDQNSRMKFTFFTPHNLTSITNELSGSNLEVLIDGVVKLQSLTVKDVKTVSIRKIDNVDAGYNQNGMSTHGSSPHTLVCEYIDCGDNIPLYLDEAEITLNYIGSPRSEGTLRSGGLEIYGGKLTINAVNADGIMSHGDILITQGAKVTVDANGSNPPFGISMDVSGIATRGAVTAVTRSITIDGGSKVEVRVEANGTESRAIHAQHNVKIEGGSEVIATATTTATDKDKATGISSMANLTISGRQVTATGDGYGIFAVNDIDMTGETVVDSTGETVAGIASGTGDVRINITGTDPSKSYVMATTSSATGNMPVFAGKDVTTGDGVYEEHGYPITDNNSGYTAPDPAAVVSAATITPRRGIFGNSPAKFLNGRPVVHFNAQGGSVNPAKATANVNYQLFELPVPVRPGYSFLSWNLAANGSGTTVDTTTKFQSTTATSGDTIYAQWQPLASGVPASGGCPNGHAAFHWVTAISADEHNDGEIVFMCSACGHELYRVLISGYGVFQKNTAEKIRNAAPGATVEITTSRWISFHRSVMEALAARPDVTLTISFLDGEYRGNRRIVTIPAGYDTLSLLNGSDYCGFLYLGSKFGLK